MNIRAYRHLAGVLVTLIAGSSLSYAQSPGFTIGENNVIRPAGETTVVSITVTGLTGEIKQETIASLKIVELGLIGKGSTGSIVAFGSPEAVGLSAGGFVARVTATIKPLPPLGTSEFHQARISLGDDKPIDYALQYTLSTKPAAAVQWSVRGSADAWAMSWSDPVPSRCYGLVVQSQDEPLSGVSLALSTLKDSSGRAFPRQQMHLRESGAEEATNPTKTLYISPNTARPLSICVTPDGSHRQHGTFDGVVRFSVAGSSATQDLPLKILATSRGQKLFGLAIAFLGLALSSITAGLLRPQLARLQVRRATAAVRDALGQFVNEVNRTLPPTAPRATMTRVAGDQAESISDENLEMLLPPRFALPGSDPPADMTATLKAKLDAASSMLEGLLVLLRRGSPALLALFQRDPTAALPLFTKLDAAAATITNARDAQAKVDEILKALEEILKSLAGGRESGAHPAAAAPITAEQLNVRMEILSAAAWATWGLVSLVIAGGWIATKADFGSVADLVTSFLWGFGVTTFGAGIQNLQPSAVGTQMNLKIPK